MLEEQGESVEMDKKSSTRQSSVPPKGNGHDSKKGDNGAGKSCPKAGKRRENGCPRPRSDQGQVPRKTFPQKSRPLGDKRPRARGYYGDNQREEVTKSTWTEPEYGSVQAWGSKKSNLNHLLNFHFEPRDPYGHRTGRGGPYRGGRGSGNRRRTVRYNKEQYLQANCQFIVREGKDYSVHTADPDTLVDWDYIEQVRIFSNEVPSCPICLYPPTAAKITRCGHIYCWSCVLHYLSLDDKAWRKCPICYESIHPSDLKSVVALETKRYAVGEEITLTLMKRTRGSTLTLPVEQWSDSEGKLHNIKDCVDTCYPKLLEASWEQVQEMVDLERVALEVQLQDEGTESLEGSYIKAALESLKERQASLELLKSARDSADAILTEHNQDEDKAEDAEDVKVFTSPRPAVEYSDAFSDEEVEKPEEEVHLEASPGLARSPSWCEGEGPGPEDAAGLKGQLPRNQTWAGEAGQRLQLMSENSEDALVQILPPDLGSDVGLEMTVKEPSAFGISEAGMVLLDAEAGDKQLSVDEAVDQLALPSSGCPSAGGKPDEGAHDAYYYYQAADGQHVYLHSVNARCLVKDYGNLQKCPHSITARIVELDGLTMSEDLRDRLRFLAHLPLTCQFQVAEVALQPPVVSQDTLSVFADEIERRKKQRQRRSREETRLANRIQRKENKQYGLNDTSSTIVRSDAPLVAAHSTSSSGVSTSESVETSPLGSPPSGGSPGGGEFAAVAAAAAGAGGGGRTGSGPEENGGHNATMSFAQMLKAGKAKPRAAWGAANAQEPGAKPRRGSESGESDSEDRVPVPTFRDSFGDAIQKALDNFSHAPDGEAKGKTEAPPAGGGGKKKKKVKMLLFTTSMSRAK